jgi:hypothetical protein
MNPPQFGKYEVTSEGGFRYEARSPAEAKFLIYTQMAGSFLVPLPREPIAIFKTVTNYEIYLRKLKERLLEAFLNRTLDQKMAERLTQKVWQELRLPEVEQA